MPPNQQRQSRNTKDENGETGVQMMSVMVGTGGGRERSGGVGAAGEEGGAGGVAVAEDGDDGGGRSDPGRRGAAVSDRPLGGGGGGGGVRGRDVPAAARLLVHLGGARSAAGAGRQPGRGAGAGARRRGGRDDDGPGTALARAASQPHALHQPSDTGTAVRQHVLLLTGTVAEWLACWTRAQ